ncbi:hypothetical protein M413DRAFT_23004 [Hebeloma cylindrosporum]|uniref:Uncharacterized protein n=1 Tax=Hebeloma cylindrosporum TaxID=76867 RepID=A0A0C3CRC4_HEBCY|nr:hypothetical protein M413DRAFT_23004 [Hebeloma cylindrosporum h7]
MTPPLLILPTFDTLSLMHGFVEIDPSTKFAHKTLLDMQVTVDPPGQFTPLHLSNNDASTPAGNESEESGDDGEHQTPAATDGIDTGIAPSSPNLEGANAEEAVKGRILVTFQSSDSAHEAWIDPQSDSEDAPFIYGRYGDNGEPEYYARISEFLPYALENSSPIKASKGRILRPGRDSASARIHLGSIEDLSKFTAPQTKALKMPMVDVMPLDSSSGDYFKCTLFLDAIEAKIPAQMSSTPSPVKASCKQASGSTTKKSSAVDDESFITFLRDLLAVGDDMPGRADKVGIALTRHLKLEAAYVKLAEMHWQRNRGGFKVPEGWRSQ